MINQVSQSGSVPKDKPKGLLYLDSGGRTGYREIDCPKCGKLVSFYPEQLIWDFDEEFEFCDVECPECKETFELNALESIFEYSFFTTEDYESA